jgi:hypothetical protein
MLVLSGSTAAVTGWTSTEFNTNCNFNEAFWLQAASWSPDDSTVYIATTGYKPNGTPAGSFPRSGLCDVAAAFPATQTSVIHNWINYTGWTRCLHRSRHQHRVISAGLGGRRTRTGVTSLGPALTGAPGMEAGNPGCCPQPDPLTGRGRR